MFEFLSRLFRRDLQAEPVRKAPPRIHNVELDAQDEKSYCVRATFPNCYIQPDYGYSSTLLRLAEEVVEETCFELLRTEQIDNYMDAGDTGYVYRVGNSRPNVLALLACNLTWSEPAQLLAVTHSIPEDEVAAMRERMRERSPFLRWPNTNPPE